MKTFNIVLTLFAFVSIINVASAQTFKGDAITGIGNLHNKTSLFNIVASQNTTSVGVSNNTRVQQIGNYNSAHSLTRSNSSDIQISQLGNRNDVSLAISANRISEDVLQVGNNHSFTDFSPNNINLHSANVLQYGANQNLILIGGQNSISDKMLVTMQGKNQTVIIRNLKN